jgi:hypothetical protein
MIMVAKTESKRTKSKNIKSKKNKPVSILDKEQENTKSLVEMGADIAGNVAGAAVGFIVAGPTGSVIGAAATPVITGILKTIGSEIRSRLYSDRELIRAGGALAFAVQKIQSNIETGRTLRSDNFFDDDTVSDRGAAKEILEGVLLAAQKEYQEKKVRFYGNLYANIVFESDVDRSQANYLIRLLDRLSFRQLCILAEFRDRTFSFYPAQKTPDVMNEFKELASLGLIEIKDSDMNGVSYIFCQALPYAKKLYKLLELDEIGEDERQILMSNP